MVKESKRGGDDSTELEASIAALGETADEGAGTEVEINADDPEVVKIAAYLSKANPAAVEAAYKANLAKVKEEAVKMAQKLAALLSAKIEKVQELDPTFRPERLTALASYWPKDAGESPAPAKRGRPPGSKNVPKKAGGKKRARKTSGAPDVAGLLALLKKQTNGAARADIMGRLKLDENEYKRLIVAAEGKIKRKGDRKLARYFAK